MFKTNKLKSAVMILRYAKDTLSRESTEKIKNIIEEDIHVYLDESIGEKWEESYIKENFHKKDLKRMSLQNFIACLDPPPLRMDTVHKIHKLIMEDLFGDRTWYEKAKENIEYFLRENNLYFFIYTIVGINVILATILMIININK